MAKTKTNPMDIEITSEILDAYLQAKEAKRTYEALDKLIKAHIKASETETLTVDGRIVSLKHQKRYMLDQKALKAVLPEAWEEFGEYKDYASIQID